MRDAEVAIHPHYFSAGLMPRLSPDQLRQKVDQVVQHHEAQRRGDEQPVRPANPLHHRMIGTRFSAHMDWTDDEFVVDYALVTLAAGSREIGGIDGGTRIARTENGMHTVAGSAVRGGDFSFGER